jgi:hypothetical protein
MNATIGAATRAAFEGLIDYAGLFPPAALAMEAAVAEYAGERNGAASWMLGRFIVPVSRLPDLHRASATRWTGAPPGLSVIVDADSDARRWFESLRRMLDEIAQLRADPNLATIEVLEIPLPAPVSARDTFDAPIGQLRAAIDQAGLRDLTAYVEIPDGARRHDLLPGAMTALARTRLGAKIRCGGVDADAFPSAEAVAGFISAASANGVAFKATAGLHHPVRHRDPATGFVMHGFLNLLAAATFAPGADEPQLREIVAEEDASAFVLHEATFSWRGRTAGLAELQRARSTGFVAYGSCSFSEPVDDLVGLGMLPAALA